MTLSAIGGKRPPMTPGKTKEREQIQPGEKTSVFVTPEWFCEGSTVFKNQRKSKNFWMPDKSAQA